MADRYWDLAELVWYFLKNVHNDELIVILVTCPCNPYQVIMIGMKKGIFDIFLVWYSDMKLLMMITTDYRGQNGWTTEAWNKITQIQDKEKDYYLLFSISPPQIEKGVQTKVPNMHVIDFVRNTRYGFSSEYMIQIFQIKRFEHTIFSLNIPNIMTEPSTVLDMLNKCARNLLNKSSHLFIVEQGVHPAKPENTAIDGLLFFKMYDKGKDGFSVDVKLPVKNMYFYKI
ncbi:hypothetical protein ACJX0J_028833, partial [Zea mays]